MSTGQMTEDERKLAQQKAMQNPEIQLILTDPIMRQVLLGLQGPSTRPCP
jgi:stress-induced-phosphoprotein 1